MAFCYGTNDNTRPGSFSAALDVYYFELNLKCYSLLLSTTPIQRGLLGT